MEKKHIEKKLESLNLRANELGAEVLRLKSVMDIEEADVTNLEKQNLVTLFYSIVGTKAEKLDKEKAEADTARINYELAKSELDGLSAEIKKCEKKLRYLDRCEEKYEELLKEKKLYVKSMETSKNDELLRLETRIAELELKLAELAEAKAEGERVCSIARAIIRKLGEVHSYHNSMQGNGKYVGYTMVDLMLEDIRNSRIADNMLAELPIQLERFKAELADTDLTFDIGIKDRKVLFVERDLQELLVKVGKLLWEIDAKTDSLNNKLRRNRDKLEELLGSFQA